MVGMMTAAAMFLGALAGLGIFVAIQGVRGVDLISGPRRERPSRPSIDQLALRTAFALGLGVITCLLTRWPVGGIAAGSLGAAIPSYRRSSDERRRSLERTEAVAAWTEMLRDTMAAAAGLNEAVIASARVAPAAIRLEVQALAVRSEHQPLNRSLRRFAAELDDPVADAVVAALALSTERQSGNLGQVLSQIATNARDQAAMRQRVEASRARTYASARFIVIVTLVFSIGLILFAPVYLEPFNSVEGQLTLVVVGGLFGSALWGLHRLAAPQPVARLITDTEAIA